MAGPIKYLGRVTIGDMHAFFPKQVQPPIRISDFLPVTTPQAFDQSEGLRFDPLMNCVYTQPLFIPHDQVITDGEATVVDQDEHLLGVESVEWEAFTVGGTNAVQNFATPNHGFQTIDIQCTDVASSDGMTLDASTVDGLDAQEMIFLMSRALFARVATDTPSTWEVRFKLGTDWYRISASARALPSMSRSRDDGASWQSIREAFRTGGTMATAIGNSGPGRLQDHISIRVQALNGYVSFTMQGESSPFVMPIDQADPEQVTFDQVRVIAGYFTHLGFSLHPIKFATYGAFRSLPHQQGFIASGATPPYYQVYTGTHRRVVQSEEEWTPGYPSGSTVTITTVPETLTTAAPQYDLEIANSVAGTYGDEDYADKTLTLSRVTHCVNGLTQPASRVGTVFNLGVGESVPIKEIVEHVMFNPESLTIDHRVEMVFDNWRGIDVLAAQTGLLGSGNVSAAVELGYHHSGLFPRFVGFGGDYQFQRPHAGSRLMTWSLTDGMQRLVDQRIEAPPNMDGWNHYYAVAWLAEKAGFTLAELDFAALVPADPFDYTAYDLQPYFLPIGQGLQPWTPVNQNVGVMELAASIQRLSGFLLFINEMGVLTYRPWVPSVYDYPRRIFQEADALGDLSEMMMMSGSSSVRNVRNRVGLIGINPFDPSGQGEVIVERREDTDSISAPPGAQPKNYVGYPKDFFWMDPRFADTTFASVSADRLYRFLRLPEYRITINCWAQPDLYPLQMVWVNDPLSNSLGLPFYIMGMTNRYSVANGRQETSGVLHLQWLDPQAFV